MTARVWRWLWLGGLTFSGACPGCSGDAARPRTSEPATRPEGSQPAARRDGRASTPDASASVDASLSAGARGSRDAASSAAPDAGGGSPGRIFAYVGGWDWSASSYPLRTFELDAASGALREQGAAVDLGANPSFLVVSADGRALFAANERETEAGGVSSARIDPITGRLTPVDHVAPLGEGFVHVALCPEQDHLLAASYNGARVAVYPVAADQRLGAALDTEAFTPGAQSHATLLHPGGTMVFVPNKGLDAIAQLAFDEATGQLTPRAQAAFADAPGSGPRMGAFSPDGATLYVMHENDSSLRSLRVRSDGTLSLLDSVSSLPKDAAASGNKGAHVAVSADGRIVYVSNRGHDSLSVFEAASDGQLDMIQNVPSRGKTPRHFAIDASGSLLVVANQGSGSLAVFAIASDGRLSPRGAPLTGLREPTTVALVTLPSPTQR